MQRRALTMSPRDAKLAVTQERTEQRAPEKCSMLFAQNAAKSARFLSILPKAKLFIAASASQQEEQNNLLPARIKKDTDFGVFFCSKYCTKSRKYDKMEENNLKSL